MFPEIFIQKLASKLSSFLTKSKKLRPGTQHTVTQRPVKWKLMVLETWNFIYLFYLFNSYNHPTRPLGGITQGKIFLYILFLFIEKSYNLINRLYLLYNILDKSIQYNNITFQFKYTVHQYYFTIQDIKWLEKKTFLS